MMGVYDRDYMRRDQRRKEQASPRQSSTPPRPAASSSASPGTGKPDPNWVFWRPKKQAASLPRQVSLWHLLLVWCAILGSLFLVIDHFMLSKRVRALEAEVRAIRAAEVSQSDQVGDASTVRVDFFRQPSGH